MSECCIDCDTGFLPFDWATGNSFIKEAPPFQTRGGCCIPCSGYLASDGSTDPRSYGLQYISIDDGAGGGRTDGRTGVHLAGQKKDLSLG